MKLAATMGIAGLAAVPLVRPKRSRDVRRSRSRVVLLKADSYAGPLEALLWEGLRAVFGPDRNPVRSKTVLLKPNLVECVPDRAINTSPAVVAAAVECFRRLGARQVLIGEGPGHQRDTRLVLEESGLAAVLDRQRVDFVDLNRDELVRTPVRSRYSGLRHLWLPRTVLASDLIVSMPKVKTHHWAGVTLSLKNLFGIVPGNRYGWPKNVLHWRGIGHSILDICSTVPIDLVIADGIVAMEGDGPLNGAAKALGCLLVADDPVAADATLTRAMGLCPERVDYLAEASRFLGNLDPADILQAGERPAALRQPFRVLPSFHYLRS